MKVGKLNSKLNSSSKINANSKKTTPKTSNNLLIKKNTKILIVAFSSLILLAVIALLIFLYTPLRDTFAGQAVGAFCSEATLCGPGEYCNAGICAGLIANYQICQTTVRIIVPGDPTPSTDINLQCLGTPATSSLSIGGGSTTPAMPGLCLPAEREATISGNQLRQGQNYCLPKYRVSENQFCASDQQCTRGICDIAVPGGSAVCLTGMRAPEESCLYDRQCLTFSSANNPDACFRERRDSTFQTGVCRNRPGRPEVTFTATTSGITNPSKVLFINPNQPIELQWRARSDTNGGPLRCFTPTGLIPGTQTLKNPTYFSYDSQPVNTQGRFNEITSSQSTDLVIAPTRFTLRCEAGTGAEIRFAEEIVEVYLRPENEQTALTNAQTCQNDLNLCLFYHYNFNYAVYEGIDTSIYTGITLDSDQYCREKALNPQNVLGCAVNDLSNGRYGNAAVYGNPSHSTNHYYSLDGSGDYFKSRLPLGDNPENINSFFQKGYTISFWINPDLLVTREEGLFSWASNTNVNGRGATDPFSFILLRRQNDNVQWYVDGGYRYVSGGPYFTRGWNHVALTFRDNEYYLYVNGLLASKYVDEDRTFSYRFQNGAVDGTTQYFGSGFLNQFTGGIDEIKGFTTFITPDQVYDMFKDQPGQLAQPISSDTRLSSCKTEGWQAGRRYTLANELTAQRDCLVIDADGVTLDCQNRFILGSATANGLPPTVGITVRGDNVLIENCNLVGFDKGIYAKGERNSDLQGLALWNNYIAAQQQAVDLNDLIGAVLLTGNRFNGPGVNAPANSRGAYIDQGVQDVSSGMGLALENNVFCGFAGLTGTDVSCNINAQATLTGTNNIFDRQTSCSAGGTTLQAARACQEIDFGITWPVTEGEISPPSTLVYFCSTNRLEPNQAANLPAGGASSGYNTQIRGNSAITEGISQFDVCESAAALREYYCRSANGEYSDPASAAAGLLRSEVIQCNCRDGACVSAPPPAAACGDNWVDAGETCDDGNTANGDGCSANCQAESIYTCASTDGNQGSLPPGAPASSFGYDIYNQGTTTIANNPSQTVTDNCDLATGKLREFYCRAVSGSFVNPSDASNTGDPNSLVGLQSIACPSGLTCQNGACRVAPLGAVCGNGVLDAGEQCDDGNTVAAPPDGCSATCSIESGWSCPTPGAACVRTGCTSHAQCADASTPQCDTSSGNCVPCNTDGACINNPSFGGNMRCSNGACVPLNSVPAGGVCISSGA